MSTEMHTREEALAKLNQGPLDVLIVGGGVVGAGIARDAAMRGLRTALVEQYDFASGTSSRSSRLLHGGLRYLAQGRVGLVHEASVEKKVVHTIAPHISQPLAFVFPVDKAPPWAQWALWKLRIGVRIYDLLCGGRNFGRSCGLNRAKTLELVPGLGGQRLAGSVRYWDGLTNDARLVIDTLRSAESAGAAVLNYCRMEQAQPDGGMWPCRLLDRQTGRPIEVVARCVVNATGPWAQGLGPSAVKLRLTKGVHLVIDRERLSLPDALVMIEGSRILFAIPWGQRVILGTTDTDYTGRPEDVTCEPEDVDYVLGVVNAAFPKANLSTADVISTWAGLRPLIANPNGKPSDISRSHDILNPAPGWYDVAGGKLTTYRLMAEQTVNRLEKHLGRSRTPCRTAQVPLLEPADAAFSGLLPPEFAPAAVEHYCRREWAVHLEDVMLRRAGWHYYHRDAEAIAVRTAEIMSKLLGWDEPQQVKELAAYRRAAGLAAGNCAADRGRPLEAGAHR